MEQFENNKKTNALLQLALKYHNAKRYNEAAWLYQTIIDTYPKSVETVQHACTNLNNLKKKIENLQPIKPKELQDGDPLLDDNEPVNIDLIVSLTPSSIHSIKEWFFEGSCGASRFRGGFWLQLIDLQRVRARLTG